MTRNPVISTAALLTHYSFDLQGQGLERVVHKWLAAYPNRWVMAAVVEALYQGRYKVDSVNRILSAWQARGQPLPHFDHDFADIVCKKLLHPMASYAQSQPSDGAAGGGREGAIAPSLTGLPAVKPPQPRPSHVPNSAIQRHAKLAIQLQVPDSQLFGES
jgi:hypothetical protein